MLKNLPKALASVLIAIPFVGVCLLTAGVLFHNHVVGVAGGWIVGIVVIGACVGLIAAPIFGVWKGAPK